MTKKPVTKEIYLEAFGRFSRPNPPFSDPSYRVVVWAQAYKIAAQHYGVEVDLD